MSLLEWMKMVARKTLDQRGVAPTPATEAAPPTSGVTQRYENLGEIARGGMGAILEVRDVGLRRRIAMKVLEPHGTKKNATHDALFVEEAQITSQLEHPNICPIHELGRDENGTPFFTMKLVKGRTLSELIHHDSYSATSPRCIRDALDVLLRVCDALSFAHSKGVLHRDLKPDNVMVGDFGQVYLMDFGVAKLMPSAAGPDGVVVTGAAVLDQGAIVGTLMYMAPEQAQGGDVDERSDVFGLGAILYEILTQVPPYYADSLGELVLMAQAGRTRPPQVMVGLGEQLPSALCAICERALSPDPANRYASVAELKAALDEFLVGGMSFPTTTVALGECIVNEGETGDTAYIIQRGFCRVYKHIDGQQVALADLGPGDVFGETAVFASTTRTATVQALTDVTLQVVSSAVFAKDLGMASAMGAFVKALALRFVAVDQQLRVAQSEIVKHQQAATNTVVQHEYVDPASALEALTRESADVVTEALLRGARSIAAERKQLRLVETFAGAAE